MLMVSKKLYQFRAGNARKNDIIVWNVAKTVLKKLDIWEIIDTLPTTHCCASILSFMAGVQYQILIKAV
jgi:hypothetical protein